MRLDDGTSGSESEHRLCEALAISALSRSKRQEILQRVGEVGIDGEVSAALSASEIRRGSEILEQCREAGLQTIPFYDSRYPRQLAVLPDPPAVLYVRARVQEWRFPSAMISVVGTRAASLETCQKTSLLSSNLASHGVCVVSGLALGIDGAAHRGALATSFPCPTLAVVAHGLDRLYPSSHLGLAQTILNREGCIVSEYPPGTEPLKHHFLERNRIIAGLSRGVVVVQAGERSGSLVTARFAANFGRDVFIMEGGQGDAAFMGGARLIEEGAIPIAGAREVIAEYALEPSSSTDDTPAAGTWRTLSLAEYLEETKCSAAEMLRREMEGRVIRLPGNKVSVLMEARPKDAPGRVVNS